MYQQEVAFISALYGISKFTMFSYLLKNVAIPHPAIPSIRSAIPGMFAPSAIAGDGPRGKGCINSGTSRYASTKGSKGGKKGLSAHRLKIGIFCCALVN